MRIFFFFSILLHTTENSQNVLKKFFFRFIQMKFFSFRYFLAFLCVLALLYGDMITNDSSRAGF